MSLFQVVGCWVTWGDPEQPTVSRTTLRFIDDTQVAVNGLNETMADLYSEGREANRETAEEIIKRLEAHKNYIPSSDLAHRDYSYVLLREYRKYIKDQTDKDQ